MCPVSAFVQFLTVVVLLLLLCHKALAEWTVNVQPLSDAIHMHETVTVNFSLVGPESIDEEHYFLISSSDTHIAEAKKEVLLSTQNYSDTNPLNGSFDITGNFLGVTSVKFAIANYNKGNITDVQSMDVIVIREQRVIDRVFTASVAILVSILYINFGCALDWTSFRSTLKKPIGPAIGFFTQFCIMPTLSYLIGLLIFPDDANMQIGMFFTGVSPGGGASNVWTVLLEGNMDLSITMSAISNLAAFGMMPLWIFTLGKEIFNRGDLSVPYTQILTYVVALIVPLALGFLMQRYMRRFAQFMARILKGFSTLLILFIIIFAIVTNLYLFELFSWQIIVSGLLLPWLGYIFGYTLAFVLRQTSADCLTIAIETGIQNTGISIFMLRFALSQPQADLTTVVPVSVAIMTPFPLLFLYLYRKVSKRIELRRKRLECSGVDAVQPLGLENDNNFNRDTKRDIPTIS